MTGTLSHVTGTPRLEPVPAMRSVDVLSDVLRVMRIAGAVFLDARADGPWAVESPPARVLLQQLGPTSDCLGLFHVVAEGHCEALQGDAGPVQLGPLDVLMVPRARAHTLRTDATAPRYDLGVLLEAALGGRHSAVRQLGIEGTGAPTRIVCGFLLVGHRFAPLVHAMPGAMHVRASPGGSGAGDPRIPTIDADEWLLQSVRRIIVEVDAARAGARVMLSRLVELVFVEMMRMWFASRPATEAGWIAALHDPHVGAALGALHADPARHWTVPDLARIAALSRSALATRFVELLGLAPMHYLAQWRMCLARELLEDPTTTVARVAACVGYDAEAAFSRAFARDTGWPPGEWRRRRLTARA